MKEATDDTDAWTLFGWMKENVVAESKLTASTTNKLVQFKLSPMK